MSLTSIIAIIHVPYHHLQGAFLHHPILAERREKVAPPAPGPARGLRKKRKRPLGKSSRRVGFSLVFGYTLLYITYMKSRKGTSARGGAKGPPFRCRGRVWIDGREGTFLGYGRIVLLERIRDHGSITKAARSMEMSYRHAWELVDSMNRQASRPLIETATGGRGGGGARLTEEGEDAVRLFWEFYGEFQDFLDKEEGRLHISNR
jgi:molybdate transport system regulatory protein